MSVYEPLADPRLSKLGGRNGSYCAACFRQSPATDRDEFAIGHIVKVTLLKFTPS